MSLADVSVVTMPGSGPLPPLTPMGDVAHDIMRDDRLPMGLTRLVAGTAAVRDSAA